MKVSFGFWLSRLVLARLVVAILIASPGMGLAGGLAEEWGDEVLYFIVLDRFADGDPGNNVDVDITAKGHFHGGDLAGLTANLDELADLGVTALWITPIVKNIPGYVTGAGFKDYGYHGYWAEDFYQLDPRFGTETEFKAMVKAAHARGIKVLLDVVYNHPGYGASYTTNPETKHWVRLEADCGADDLTQCVAGLPDFRTEDPEVADYLIDHAIRLAKMADLDGFRLDTVKHVSHEFWHRHRERVHQELGKDFFLLGELWGGSYTNLKPYFDDDKLDAGFDFTFRGSAQSWVLGRGRTIAFSRFLQKRHLVKEGYVLAHYLSSHDETGLLHQLKGDKQKFKMVVALQMTSLGLPVIYYGEEVGRIGGEWPENRSHMPWGERDIMPGKGKPRDEEMRRYYKHLIALRKTHEALTRGGYEELSVEGDLLIFARATDSESVVVAANRGTEPAEARIAVPEVWRGLAINELLSGSAFHQDGDELTIAVPGQSVRIFTATGATNKAN